ncbi:MAG: phosphoribosyltransferase family protein [Phototrophicaceae bacterium]|jgi:adenine phosphoribosyltransferase
MRETFPVVVNGVQRDLIKFEVAPGVTIAIVNILGDVELVQAASTALAARLLPLQPEVLVTAEAKSIPLVYQLAIDLNLPYVVLRKSYKTYMGDALRADSVSITTNATQTLFLDEKDRALIAGKRVVLIDDVISTGSTLEAMERVVTLATAQIVARSAIFTEGNDPAQWQHVIALSNLPVWISE